MSYKPERALTPGAMYGLIYLAVDFVEMSYKPERALTHSIFQPIPKTVAVM